MHLVDKRIRNSRKGSNTKIPNRTIPQDVENEVLDDVERFEKKKINGPGIRNADAFAPGENKNECHPRNGREKPFHDGSIASFFRYAKTPERMPNPSPAIANAIAKGFARFPADGVAVVVVSPSTVSSSTASVAINASAFNWNGVWVDEGRGMGEGVWVGVCVAVGMGVAVEAGV
jgi:hypothetical protein